MGKLGKIILLVMSFLSSESFAGQAEALQAAIKSPEVTYNVPAITRVQIINAYHCPDCYDIEISGQNGATPVAVVVRTESDGYGHMTVKFLQASHSSAHGPDLDVAISIESE